MKKICFFIPGFSNGGAQKQCIKLLNQLSKINGLDIHLIYFYEGINFKYLETDYITLHQISYSSFYNPKNILSVNRVINKIAPDVIFSWLHSCDVYSFFIKFLNPEIKWVMAERDSYYPNNIKYKLRNLLGKYSDLIISNSNKGKDYWSNLGVKSDKIIVMDNILSKSKQISEITSLEKKMLVLFAGRFEMQKNIIFTTELFCQLSRVHKNAKFLLIGEGSLLDEMKYIVRECSNIEIIPYQDDISPYFKSADIFVSLSHHEGKPNTVIENIALESLVIVSNIDEHRQILGEHYPCYVDLDASLENTFSRVNLIIENYNNFDHVKEYEFAKESLKHMDPSIVANKYCDILTQI